MDMFDRTVTTHPLLTILDWQGQIYENVTIIICPFFDVVYVPALDDISISPLTACISSNLVIRGSAAHEYYNPLF